jgi:colanic acid/amylovoran biosynthesis glycosyltransferase
VVIVRKLSPEDSAVDFGNTVSKRLVLIVPSFPKLSETFIVSKFLGLLERGWDVYVVCGESEPAEWRNFPELDKCPQARARVKVSWLHRPQGLAALLVPVAVLSCVCRNPCGTWRYLRKGARQFGPLGVLRRLYLDAGIVGLSPDLVHFEFGALAVGRMHLKLLLGSSVVASFRGYDLNLCGLEEPDYFREVWEQADALHLLGEGLWQRAQRRGCPPDKPHALIPPAIDTDFFKPGDRLQKEDTLERPLRILSVGRLTWEKGYEYAIEAIRLLTGQGVRSELRIIGDGGMLEALAYARHQLSVERSVQFLGALPRAKVREEMLAADIFLHASVSEGFGNTVIEAQAMALPVVCSDAGGLPENVADGETGFVVSRRDAQTLAEKLAVLAREPGLRQRMGQAGRRRVLGRFRLDDQISAFEQLYQGVLGDRGLDGERGF